MDSELRFTPKQALQWHMLTFQRTNFISDIDEGLTSDFGFQLAIVGNSEGPGSADVDALPISDRVGSSGECLPDFRHQF